MYFHLCLKLSLCVATHCKPSLHCNCTLPSDLLSVVCFVSVFPLLPQNSFTQLHFCDDFMIGELVTANSCILLCLYSQGLCCHLVPVHLDAGFYKRVIDTSFCSKLQLVITICWKKKRFVAISITPCNHK